MIRINLSKKRKAGGTSGGFDLSNLLNAFKSSGSDESGETKKFDLGSPIVKVLLGMAAIYLVDDALTTIRNDELKKVDAKIAKLEADKAAVQAKLDKIKGFEPIKKQLEEDELTIRTKLDTVTKLLENRNAPSKMLMQIAQVIPAEVWLTDMGITSEKIEFKGGTPGHNQVSDFIRALNNTSLFGEVTLKGVQETTTASNEQRFQTFELMATRR